MATIYLHIGAPKTATSTLQGALVKARRSLLMRGVLYPSSCRQGHAHHVLVCDLIDKYQRHPMPPVWYGDYPRGRAWSALREELDAHPGVDRAVLSSELFFGQSRSLPRMLEDIRGALPGHEFRVIVYLRPQHQLYSSFYNQDVKGARQWSGSAYEFYDTHQIFQRDYLQVLRIWARAFGTHNVIVRPYEHSQWPGGSVLKDFSQVLGVEGVELSTGRDSNEGLGMNQLYIKLCLNRVGFAKELNEQVTSLLQQLCPEAPSSGTLYVNKGLYKRQRREWEAVNVSVAREFLGREQLFEQPLPQADELQRHAVDGQVLCTYLQALAVEFAAGHHRHLRPLFARAAQLMIAEQSLWRALDGELAGRLQAWCLEDTEER